VSKLVIDFTTAPDATHTAAAAAAAAAATDDVATVSILCITPTPESLRMDV
jgi:hypothetical protein